MMTPEQIAEIRARAADASKGPWKVDYFICRADYSDVKSAKERGNDIEIGDEFWRVPKSIGPIDTNHDHWAGTYLDMEEDDVDFVKNAQVDVTKLLEHCAELEAKLAEARRATIEECLAVIARSPRLGLVCNYRDVEALRALVHKEPGNDRA